MNPFLAIIAVIIISLLSVIVAIPFLIKKRLSNRSLLFLLSLSVGVLLSTAFIELIPESLGHGHEAEHADEEMGEHEEEHHPEHEEAEEHEAHQDAYTPALLILLGFIVMFILEKFVHCHHTAKCEGRECGHGHAYNLAPINLIGDGVHNFIDGLVIAGAFAVNITVGITATISIIFHEIPQEIADFGVLLYSGLSKKKALIFNLLSAITAIIGTIVGILLVGRFSGFTRFIIPFAAGNFIYIAASNLTPQLHRHCRWKDTMLHLFAIILGIAIIVLVEMYGPGHVHG
jgi:zinc and cadmium transporter